MKERVAAFSILFDPLTMVEAIDVVAGWLEKKEGCQYVVTPNVDHIVHLQENPKLKEAYDEASLVLTDGKPVRFALNLLGKPVPETVTGSDLVPNIFDRWQAKKQKLTVFLLGGGPEVTKIAAENIELKWPAVKVVGIYSPPFGFEDVDYENQLIIEKIEDCRPDLLIIGLGAPKQEIWIHSYCREVKAGAALCVGATIDFLAGEQKRAPKWMQKMALEWLFRMLSDPGRLVKRYARGAWLFPQIVWREKWAAKKGK